MCVHTGAEGLGVHIYSILVVQGVYLSFLFNVECPLTFAKVRGRRPGLLYPLCPFGAITYEETLTKIKVRVVI